MLSKFVSYVKSLFGFKTSSIIPPSQPVVVKPLPKVETTNVVNIKVKNELPKVDAKTKFVSNHSSSKPDYYKSQHSVQPVNHHPVSQYDIVDELPAVPRPIEIEREVPITKHYPSSVFSPKDDDCDSSSRNTVSSRNDDCVRDSSPSQSNYDSSPSSSSSTFD